MGFEWPEWMRGFPKDERYRTLAIINLTAIFEQADVVILPAMTRHISKAFDIGPDTFGLLMLSRGLTQALTSPIGGIAGHFWNRIHVIAAGCAIWACMAFVFGLSTSVYLAFAVWAVNGFGLSLVIPNTQSVTADMFESASRGRAFGTLYATIAVGSVLGVLYATNMSRVDYSIFVGWRFVMFSLALFSAAVGVLNFWFAKDPRAEQNIENFTERELEEIPLTDDTPIGVVKNEQGSKLRVVINAFGTVIKIPTFAIIIIQGVVGSMPWKAIGTFFILYLQLIGISDFGASICYSLFAIGSGIGALLGGWAGDIASQYSPNHGRVLVCQFSVFTGIPLSYAFFQLLPENGKTSTVLAYASLSLIMAVLITWASPACNNPIFAEIVPVSHRNIVYAFDRCLEDALSSPVSYIVGWAAKSWFGYTGIASVTGIRDVDINNAEAIGNAVMWFSVVPWTLCLIFYSGLHYTYPRDKCDGSFSYSRITFNQGI